MNIQESIVKLRNIIQNSELEIVRLTNLIAQFPDVIETVDRWKVVRFKSKSINSIVTDCDIKHSCGCCNDSPLKIYPFTVTEFGKIFSDPCGIVIGEKCWDGGDVEVDGWQNLLRKENIPELIINKAEVYFKGNLPYFKLQEMLGEQDE